MDFGPLHIPDANMPADFLTKWIPAAKFATSIAYVTNSRALGAFSHPSAQTAT